MRSVSLLIYSIRFLISLFVSASPSGSVAPVLRLLHLVCSLFYLSSPASVFASQELVDDAASALFIQEYADSPTWLRLLHVKQIKGGEVGRKSYESTIVSNGFYLTGIERFDPVSEMDATLKLLSDRSHEVGEDPLYCRYPARFLWLGSIYKASILELLASCTELALWADLENTEALSLLQVSGYFGNPASAFGHLLLRANKKDSSGLRGLLDLGFNFGAGIPENENTLVYILKGIFGGYTAGFSNDTFYTQDFVYSATENRDMWSYELDLNRYQIQLLLYHLWELRNVEFNYYFLKYNCAYHMAELLELVFDESFELDRKLWYPPISVFHKLSQLSEQALQAKRGGLVNEVSFVPSSQRELYTDFNELSTKSKLSIENYVTDAWDTEARYESQTLDFLLKFADYKMQTANIAETERYQQDKQLFLRKRFELPASLASENRIESRYTRAIRQPPASGPEPAQVALGFTARSDSENYSTLEFAPYSFNALQSNRGSLIDSTFELLSVRIAIDSHNVALEQLHLLKIEKMADNSIDLKGEQAPAWQLALGFKRPYDRCKACLRGFAEGGVGRSLYLGGEPGTQTSKLLFGFTTMGIDQDDLHLGLSAGLLFRPAATLGVRLQSSWRWYLNGWDKERSYSLNHEIQGLWTLAPGLDVTVEADFARSYETLRLNTIFRF